MSSFPKYLEKLKDAFYALPSVTPRSAEKMAVDFVRLPREKRSEILKDISAASTEIKVCRICGNYSNEEVCEICSDSSRDSGVVCVVEEPFDVYAVEDAGFNGKYHILGGRIDPLNKISPSDLRINSLMKRLSSGKIKEIILATNLNRKGIATARYIFNEIKREFPEIAVTQPAHGLSEGTEIVYVNPHTLKEAFEDRKEFG
ncbi:MAG: recombination protein RecR [Elusimicrobia bacterium]|nr:recombination protein RecR [Elusimicrobiota bacterium]